MFKGENLVVLKNGKSYPTISDSRPHSAVMSENGLDHESGIGMSAVGISCVLRR
jgi:hypothetical protein